MSFELKAKRKKQEPEDAAGDALDAAMAEQGIRPQDLPALLASLYGTAPADEPHQEWFTSADGKERVRELVAFCRMGKFRIC